MISIEIDASGPVQALNVIGENLGDFTEPTERVLMSGLTDAQEQIESGGSMFGNWPGYSPFTPIVAKALGREMGGTMLLGNGGIVASLARGGPDNLFEAGPEGGQAGTSYPPAVFQQKGTDRTFHVLQGSGFSTPGIPEREFLLWREDRLPEYDKIFSDHVFKGVAGEL